MKPIYDNPLLKFAFNCNLRRYDEGFADGLLRLHSTYRHDLKIYSSVGRCMLTRG